MERNSNSKMNITLVSSLSRKRSFLVQRGGKHNSFLNRNDMVEEKSISKSKKIRKLNLTNFSSNIEDKSLNKSKDDCFLQLKEKEILMDNNITISPKILTRKTCQSNNTLNKNKLGNKDYQKTANKVEIDEISENEFIFNEYEYAEEVYRKFKNIENKLENIELKLLLNSNIFKINKDELRRNYSEDSTLEEKINDLHAIANKIDNSLIHVSKNFNRLNTSRMVPNIAFSEGNNNSTVHGSVDDEGFSSDHY